MCGGEFWRKTLSSCHRINTSKPAHLPERIRMPPPLLLKFPGMFVKIFCSNCCFGSFTLIRAQPRATGGGNNDGSAHLRLLVLWHCGEHTVKPEIGVWTPIPPIPHHQFICCSVWHTIADCFKGPARGPTLLAGRARGTHGGALLLAGLAGLREAVFRADFRPLPPLPSPADRS